MNFEIVADTSCNLPFSLVKELGLHIIPLNFYVDGVEHQSYLKDSAADLAPFYDMMREGKVITTSLPNILSTEEEFKEILDAGSDLLYIGFSSAMSGTFAAISMILDRLRESYPNQKIYYVDTLAASAGIGLLIYYAVLHANEGKSIEEVRDWVEDNKLKVGHWFTVDDLMFLLRGGRVKKSAAFAGTLLKVKPVLHVDDEGRLIPIEKVRGRKKSLDMLVENFLKYAVEPYTFETFLVHGDCLDDARYVADEVVKRAQIKEPIISQLDPVIGAHAGPGTVAFFFFAKKR
ncbi:MAG: DegV family protein [Eggerthellaceae bacterium]